MAKGRCVSLCIMSISRLMAAKLRNSVPMPPNPPALETAAASSAEVQVPIGARMIGTSMPNKGQSGVVNMASSPHSARATTSNRAASRHLQLLRHHNTANYRLRRLFSAWLERWPTKDLRMHGGNAGARPDVLRMRFGSARAFLSSRTFAMTQRAMTQRFKIGDHVSWNSEAGRVTGKIVRVHTKDVDYKGYIHHASKDEPQYEIKSDKTA